MNETLLDFRRCQEDDLNTLFEKREILNNKIHKYTYCVDKPDGYEF